MLFNKGSRPNSSSSTSDTPFLFLIVPSHCCAFILAASGVSSIALTVDKNIAGLSSGACERAISPASLGFASVGFFISPKRPTARGTFDNFENKLVNAEAAPPAAKRCLLALSILSCGSSNGIPSDIGPPVGGIVSVKSELIKPPSFLFPVKYSFLNCIKLGSKGETKRSVPVLTSFINSPPK